jgi:cytochrome P450
MLLRLGELRLVVVSSATAAREVLKTHDAIFGTRPQSATTRILARNGVGVALAPHGEHWRQNRMLCVNELLCSRRVRSLQSTREDEVARLVASLASESAASPDHTVNLSSHLAVYVNDAVVRAVVGDRITDRDAFLECMDEGVQVAAGFSLADMFPSSSLVRVFSGSMRRLEAATDRMMRVVDGVIEEKRARRSAGAGAGDVVEDLLDVLLSIQTDGSPLHMGTIRAMITVSQLANLVSTKSPRI